MARLLHSVDTTSYTAYMFSVSAEDENAVISLENVTALFAKKACQYLEENKGLSTLDPTSDTHQVPLLVPFSANSDT